MSTTSGAGTKYQQLCEWGLLIADLEETEGEPFSEVYVAKGGGDQGGAPTIIYKWQPWHNRWIRLPRGR
jgi:hypothetical protein